MITVLAIVSFVYAIVLIGCAARSVRAVPLLERVPLRAPEKWPRVSMVITARDEESTIEAAMDSKLQDDYPDVEFIVVDDRSTDRTGPIVDALAARDTRVVPVHVASLPEGWLGKVHALHNATLRASGEWILFSDADVHLAPSTLRRAIAYCEERGMDHLAVFPEVWSSSFLLDVVMNTFFRLTVVLCRAWAVEDPRSSAAAGGGNFNLVRRSALERTRGFEWLRLEVIDDAALAQMLKQAGARTTIANACGLVKLHFYTSLPEMVRAMEKNAFAVFGRFRVTRFIVCSSTLLALEMSPLVSLLAGHGVARFLGAAALAISSVTALLVARWLRRPLLPALLDPLGMLILIGAMTRATYLTLVRRGIVWRGTRYALDELRRGMRLQFP